MAVGRRRRHLSLSLWPCLGAGRTVPPTGACWVAMANEQLTLLRECRTPVKAVARDRPIHVSFWR